MGDTDRIKLAKAMGWCHEIHDGIGSWFNRGLGKAFCDCPDPFTKASDDYAVLEWMRGQGKPGTLVAALECVRSNALSDYQIGDFARAACAYWLSDSDPSLTTEDKNHER